MNLKKASGLFLVSTLLLLLSGCGSDAQGGQIASSGTGTSPVSGPSSPAVSLQETVPAEVDIASVDVCGMAQGVLDSYPEPYLTLDTGMGGAALTHQLKVNASGTTTETTGEKVISACIINSIDRDSGGLRLDVELIHDPKVESKWDSAELTDAVGDRKIKREFKDATLRLQDSVFLRLTLDARGDLNHIESNYSSAYLPILEGMAASWDDRGHLGAPEENSMTSKSDLCKFIDQELVRSVLFSTPEEDIAFEFDPYESNSEVTAACTYSDEDVNFDVDRTGAKFVKVVFTGYETKQNVEDHLPSYADGSALPCSIGEEGAVDICGKNGVWFFDDRFHVIANSWVVTVFPGATDESELSSVRSAGLSLAESLEALLQDATIEPASFQN